MTKLTVSTITRRDIRRVRWHALKHNDRALVEICDTASMLWHSADADSRSPAITMALRDCVDEFNAVFC